METKSISRRDLLKSSSVLIVGFSFFGNAARALAQGDGLSVDGMDPTVLDSWMAISKDGTVTVFTGKVELGTGVVTALAQIVAEELDVSFNKVYMESGDTDTAVDQGVTAAARTIERGGVQLRQASAAARQELLKLAAANLDAPADMLTVTDGVVSVIGNPWKKIAYGDLPWRQALQHKNRRRRSWMGHESSAGCSGQESERLQDRRKIDSTRRSPR